MNLIGRSLSALTSATLTRKTGSAALSHRNHAICDTDSNATVTAGNGNNIILATGADDTLRLGDDSNLLIATGDDTTIVRGTGNNQIYLTGAHDRVTVGSIAGSAGGLVTIRSVGADAAITAAGGNVQVTAMGGGDLLRLGIGGGTNDLGRDDNQLLSSGARTIHHANGGVNNAATLDGAGSVTLSGLMANHQIVR